MKVLLLSRYSRRAPNSRLRSYQYLPYLAARGIHVHCEPFSTDLYLRNFYAGRAPDPWDILRSYLRRVLQVLDSRGFDLLWVEHEMLPYLPAFAETVCNRQGIPFMVDFDDAVFERYRRHRRAWVRHWLGGKIDTVMRRAAAVIAGNAYLADHAGQAGARRVHILPTVVDLARYPQPGAARPRHAAFTIGWIGTRTTAAYLKGIAPALETLARQGGAATVLIGSGPVRLDGVLPVIREWSEDTEVEAVSDFDVGVMPLPDDPWTLGKCGYKLIQYMACGLPVVASPVGVNPAIVEHGKTGFLATTQTEWVQALTTLRDNPALRREMGTLGYRKVRQTYSLQVTAPRLERVIRGLLQ